MKIKELYLEPQELQLIATALHCLSRKINTNKADGYICVKMAEQIQMMHDNWQEDKSKNELDKDAHRSVESTICLTYY